MGNGVTYSAFPRPPSSPRTQGPNRQSTDSRTRPSFEQPPHPPPSAPLPPIPPADVSARHVPGPVRQPLSPHSDHQTPVRLPLRRKTSPNREFADFQRELAKPSARAASPPRHRGTSPPPSSKAPSSKASNRAPPSRQSHRPAEPPDEMMHSTSMLSTSSASSISSLAKPPVFLPSANSVSSSNPPAQRTQPPSRQPRPNTVYFHGSIGGAGNYRKVKTENKRAPRAYAENAEPLRRAASPTRFLSSLFGSQKGGRSPTSHHSGGGSNYEERVSGSEDSVREEVNLGAAEMIKRKMVGGAWRKKGGQ